jgi:hypothetical protein
MNIGSLYSITFGIQLLLGNVQVLPNGDFRIAVPGCNTKPLTSQLMHYPPPVFFFFQFLLARLVVAINSGCAG